MSIRANEDIKKILLQLNEIGLPFKNYSFSLENGELVLLGKGSVGSVYAAEKKSRRKKKYAIKVNGFGKRTVSSEFFRTSMSRQTTMAISNENIIPIHEYAELSVWLDEDNNVLNAEKNPVTEKEGALHLQFVLMEKESPVISVDKNRRRQISCKPLREYSETEVLQLAIDIGYVLLDAHKNNVLHKDVKLENIFYSEKKKKYMLGDFGIAEEVKDGTSTVFSGTKGYAAPEVLALKWRHDATADIYSLGMVLYLAMNDFCFPESNKQFVVNAEKQYEEGYIPSRPKHGSDKLWAIVEKMLMFDADDRYQYMEAALDDLKALIYKEKMYSIQRHRKSYGIMGAICLFFGIWISKEGENIPLEITDIRWIKITFYSLAVVMLIYGAALKIKWDTPFEQDAYTKGVFWRLIMLDYTVLILLGITASSDMVSATIIPGRNGMLDMAYYINCIVVEYDVIKIGMAGLLFCIVWTIREKVLLLYDR